MNDDYSKMTDEDFDNLLSEVIDTTFIRPSQLLSIPGIYEILAEEFNNNVLDEWQRNQGETS